MGNKLRAYHKRKPLIPSKLNETSNLVPFIPYETQNTYLAFCTYRQWIKFKKKKDFFFHFISINLSSFLTNCFIGSEKMAQFRQYRGINIPII